MLGVLTEYDAHKRVEANRPVIEAAAQRAVDLADAHDLHGYRKAVRLIRRLRRENARLVAAGIKSYWRAK